MRTRGEVKARAVFAVALVLLAVFILATTLIASGEAESSFGSPNHGAHVNEGGYNTTISSSSTSTPNVTSVSCSETRGGHHGHKCHRDHGRRKAHHYCERKCKWKHVIKCGRGAKAYIAELNETNTGGVDTVDVLSCCASDVDGDGINEVLMILEARNRTIYLACYKLNDTSSAPAPSLILLRRVCLNKTRSVADTLVKTGKLIAVCSLNLRNACVEVTFLNTTSWKVISEIKVPIECIVPGWIYPKVWIAGDRREGLVYIVYPTRGGTKIIAVAPTPLGRHERVLTRCYVIAAPTSGRGNVTIITVNATTGRRMSITLSSTLNVISCASPLAANRGPISREARALWRKHKVMHVVRTGTLEAVLLKNSTLLIYDIPSGSRLGNITYNECPLSLFPITPHCIGLVRLTTNTTYPELVIVRAKP